MLALVIEQLKHYHTYVQVVGTAHMTWFAFQFAANGTAFSYYAKHQVPQLRRLFLVGNSMGVVGSACVATYYFVTNNTISTLLASVEAAPGLTSPMPLYLWSALAITLSVFCVLMTVGWYVLPSVRFPDGERLAQDRPSSSPTAPQQTRDGVSEIVSIVRAVEPKEPQTVRPKGLLKRWAGEFQNITIKEFLTACGAVTSLFIATWAVVVSLQSLSVSNTSLRESAALGVYSLGHDSNRIFLEHPELRMYFDKQCRGSMSDKELMDRVKKMRESSEEDKKKWAMIESTCEILADRNAVIYLHRHLLSDEDWDTWWNYFCDLYDESPVLQDFYTRRKRWYTTKLDDKSNRAKLYRGKKRWETVGAKADTETTTKQTGT